MQKDIIVVFFNDWRGIIDECRYRDVLEACYVTDGRYRKVIIKYNCAEYAFITYEYKIETTYFTYLFLRIDDAIRYLSEDESHTHITNLDKHFLRLFSLKQVYLDKELVEHISLLIQLRNCMLGVIGTVIAIGVVIPFLVR